MLSMSSTRSVVAACGLVEDLLDPNDRLPRRSDDRPEASEVVDEMGGVVEVAAVGERPPESSAKVRLLDIESAHLVARRPVDQFRAASVAICRHHARWASRNRSASALWLSRVWA